ncbi:MAG: aspartyl protease family protein [Candidatus Korobacteraceae bacterium]
MNRRPLAFLLALLTLWLPVRGIAQAASPTSESSEMAAADRLFMSGALPEAAAKYQAIINADPRSVAAQVGLIRIYLIQQKVDEALATLNAALALIPNDPLLLLTQGDVQFRLGKISDAERSYIKAENLNPKDPAPYLGLTRVYRSYSLYRHASDEMNRAREIAPNDMAVQLLWLQSLPWQARIAAIQAYLAGPGAQNPQAAKPMQQYLYFLQHNPDPAAQHSCRLASNVEETNTKLLAVPRAGMQLGASGLAVKLNKEELHLAVDTGASGILLGRTAAEKAGVKRLAYRPVAGMGDAGEQGGYTAVADQIRIGDLEFQDCVVRVTDSATPVTGLDGLIGTDVFSSYLIDIDIPGAKLKLSPLPKRPDEAAAPASLKTTPEEAPEVDPASPAASLPKDAYVAPEMANWTKVYRFKQILLVPTLVDQTGPVLFMIDTGSFSNVLSTRAAREVTQIRSDPATQVSGLSGSVAKVYRADKAALQFGRYEQQNQDIVTFDLSAVCKTTGTEVSGILGFAMLRILQIKIDYRDGLVDFLYDPHHLPKGMRIGK